MPAIPARMAAASTAAILLTAIVAPFATAQLSSGGCPVTGGGSGTGLSIAAFDPVEFLEGDAIVNGGASDDDGREEIPPLTQELYEEIQREIEILLSTSVDFWPFDADFGTYRGLFVRLAWHCAGSYRDSDGRGGCDGSRIRFFPERGWPDNVNLDKAIRILEPLHERYKKAISFGDLIVLTGNVAITSGGGDVLGFCGGRQDDQSGRASLQLGPTPQQVAIADCEINGLCQSPIGPGTVGLIYVNPAGPADVDIEDSEGRALAAADNVRTIFSRMGFGTDRAQVAIIGGGHIYGKVHGACPDGAGPGPLEQPEMPWPGECGTGVGLDTFSSGFEGPWNDRPTEFTTRYFELLRDFMWQPFTGPAGNTQWQPVNFPGNDLPIPEVDGQLIQMLTTDIAFIRDPDYKALIEEYADDLAGIKRDFAFYWYQLTTQDMGAVTRCTGPDVPPQQPWQDPLPVGGDECDDASSPDALLRANTAVKRFIEGDAEKYVPQFTKLAYNCAATFRATSNSGGCNGARILFPPQSEFSINQGLDDGLEGLAVLGRLLPNFSSADLIVLAGGAANEVAGAPPLPFCAGRVDTKDAGETDFSPRTYYPDPVTAVIDNALIMGMTARQAVALAARPVNSAVLSNAFFTMLLNNEWTFVGSAPTGASFDDATGSFTVQKPEMSTEFNLQELQDMGPDPLGESIPDQLDIDFTQLFYESTSDSSLRINALEFALVADSGLKSIVEEYSVESDVFGRVYGEAWVKLMNADRYDGPTGNLCTV